MDLSQLYKIMQEKRKEAYVAPSDNFVLSPEQKQKIDFLNKIKQIESSNGENTDHPEIESGIHKGYSAIGNYGLMPLTVKDTINSAVLNKEPITPDLQNLKQIDPHYYKDIMEENPNLQDETAQLLAKKVLNRFKGDEDESAYSWNNGSNLSPDDISDKDLDKSDYVQKFRKLMEK